MRLGGYAHKVMPLLHRCNVSNSLDCSFIRLIPGQDWCYLLFLPQQPAQYPLDVWELGCGSKLPAWFQAAFFIYYIQMCDIFSNKILLDGSQSRGLIRACIIWWATRISMTFSYADIMQLGLGYLFVNPIFLRGAVSIMKGHYLNFPFCSLYQYYQLTGIHVDSLYPFHCHSHFWALISAIPWLLFLPKASHLESCFFTFIYFLHSTVSTILIQPFQPFSQYFFLSFLASMYTPRETMRTKGWKPGSKYKREDTAFVVLSLS